MILVQRTILASTVLALSVGCSGSVDPAPAGGASAVPLNPGTAAAPGVSGAGVAPGAQVPGAQVSAGSNAVPPAAAPSGVVEPGGVIAPAAAPGCAAPEPLARRLRALNGAQYRNTLASVLDVEASRNPFLLSDKSSQFSTRASLFRLDVSTTEAIRENARQVSQVVAANALESEECLQEASPACVRGWVETLGRQLYREPLGDEQAEKLTALFKNAQDQSEPLEGARLVVRAMLSSPRFLFRKEVGQLDAATGQYVLTPHEVASALAYTLTDAPPDEALSADADAGMAPEELIQAHATRLIQADADGRRGMLSFLQEFFAVQGFDNVRKDTELYPEFDDGLR